MDVLSAHTITPLPAFRACWATTGKTTLACPARLLALPVWQAVLILACLATPMDSTIALPRLAHTAPNPTTA